MKSYTTDVRKFNDAIDLVETNDRVNQSNDNASAKQLLQNDLYLKGQTECVKSIIGYDEYNAEKSYAKGNYFITNNTLCKALTDIAPGDELVSGTNYEATSIENEFASINSKISYDFTNAKYLTGTANAVRRGNVVTITYTGDWKEGTPANNIGTIATLPENFIPAVRCQTVCIPFNNIQIIIDTSGNILAHNYGSAIAAQSAGRFLLTYVAKD